MGKKSLIKSTSKKKTAGAKKTGAKKVPAKKAAGKKAAKKKAAPKKAAPEKKAAPKKAAPKKNAAPKKPALKKTAAPKKAAPEKKATPKKVVLKKTVSKTIAAKKVAPKKAPAKKLTVKELLNLKFEWPQPGKQFKPARIKTKFPVPPPLISSTDKKEVQRIKTVLMRSFDMTQIRELGKKAAAKNAAAEKAAAKKTAAKKATAEKVTVSYDKTTAAPAPPVDRTEQYFTFGAAGIAILLFLLVIGASMNNSGSYYIKSAQGAIEIWQGKFAPLGEKLLITLPGVPVPEEIQPRYEKNEVFPLIYGHYIDKADTLLAAPGFPDFEEIKKYLEKALKFAHTGELKNSVYARIDGIDIAIYMYKANVAASRTTSEDLKIALDHLDSAAALNPDETLLKLIAQKRVIFSEALAAIEARSEEEARAAEEALAAQEQAAAAAEEAGQDAAQKPVQDEGQQAATSDH